MSRVLVVDDEEPIVDAISYNLKKDGFDVDTALDADECIEKIRISVPDALILDVMLPSGSGIDICRYLHEQYSSLPILLLTARAGEHDRLRGFDAGADDYVSKPFSMRELTARLRAVLRRTNSSTVNSVQQSRTAAAALLALDGIKIDADRREVLKDGTTIPLTRKEFDLLSVLAQNKGRVFDRQTLLNRVWGEDSYVDDRTVDVHIRWLREKIERLPGQPEFLLTVRGVGYKYRG